MTLSQLFGSVVHCAILHLHLQIHLVRHRFVDFEHDNMFMITQKKILIMTGVGSVHDRPRLTGFVSSQHFETSLSLTSPRPVLTVQYSTNEPSNDASH